jgi:hypothetical protein
MEMLGLAINQNSCGMDIRIESPISMLFRMADVLTEHRCFSTDIALQGEYSFDFLIGVL